MNPLSDFDPISYRLARPDEYEAVAAVKVDASGVMGEGYVTRPLPLDVFEKYAPLGGIFVAVDGEDAPVGYALAYDRADDLYLRHLFVRLGWARRGIGAELLKKTIKTARKTKRRAVTLTTGGTVPWNAPFYSRHGFLVLNKTMPDYLRAELETEITHFSPANLPWIQAHPEHLPRVAMERVLTRD